MRAGLLIAGTTAAAAVVAAPLVAQWIRQSHGAELFDGRRPLVARIAGHDERLPPMASRCINCHRGPQATGGILSAEGLTQRIARRGGPPSRYDSGTLCRLLREGIDPAHVMVTRTMPRFDVDDAACAALWAHLSKR
ncbi:MAG: hypothetical protein KIT60_26840 [Burkholderiaceae bacterium]|nr:hypothetical protein [Burkholderiaceae bacterium]